MRLDVQELLISMVGNKMKKENILIVEDCTNTGRLFEHYLVGEGYETSHVRDGAEAWKALKESQPSLIMLDENLGGISGNELLKKIRAVSKWQGIPIIFASGCNDESLKINVFQNGANDFILKPLSGKDLVVRVKHHLRVARQQSQLRNRGDQLESLVEQRTKKLHQSNLLLKSFTWSASHHLQEPLRKIIIYANLLKKKYSGSLDEQGLDYVERIADTGKRLRGFLDAQVQFSVLENPEQQFSHVDLWEVVSDVLEDLEVLIDETGARITCKDLPKLSAEKFQMRQLFYNLVENALQFRADNVRPEIWIEGGSPDSGWLKITVRDNGIGFDNKYCERIFAPYQRLQRRSGISGSGMGLALCRRIVTHHRGEIEARGEPGQGSLFTIHLPEHLSLGKG